ncbi:dual OB domain-containing protein [Megasphaera sp.]|uniref:dual OB domain-containing protein n=1 Tax=Megasphaera sp. TaxID=2023260 RepID=UPI003FF0F476
MKKSIIILAESAKYGESCVAGFDIQKKQLIRLVADENGGPIPNEYLNHVDPLDLVEVEINESVPLTYQPENYRIDLDVPVEFKGKIQLQTIIETMRAFPQERLIFGNPYKVLRENEISDIGKSLACYHVSNLQVYVSNNYQGRPKSRADFDCNGQHYKGIHVTDRDFFDLEEKKNIGEAYLIMSLPNKPWMAEDGTMLYFKFIAKIFPLNENL